MSDARSRLRPWRHASCSSVETSTCSRLRRGLARHAGQREQTRRHRLHARGQQLRLVDDRFRRRLERLEDRQRQTGAAARRVDGDLGRGLEAGDARAVLVPIGQAGLPAVGFLRSESLGGELPGAGFVGVHPRLELLRRQAGEGQHQVREIALRVDGEHRQAVDGGFFDERDAETGLAAAGHADADGVRQQIRRVVEHRFGSCAAAWRRRRGVRGRRGPAARSSCRRPL